MEEKRVFRNTYSKNSTKKMLMVMVTGFLLSAFSVHGAHAQIEIGSCTQITSPGVYALNQSILDSSANTCVNISSNNVIFDGNGYTIDGVHAPFTHGVFVAHENVTVKNLTFRDWNYGIYFVEASNGSISSNTGSSNVYDIYLQSSGNITVSGNNASNTGIGVYLSGSDRNTIIGNTGGNYSNTSVLLFQSDNNTLVNNKASNNGFGILLSMSNDNVLSMNDLINNSNDNARDILGTNNRWDNGLDMGNHYSNFDEPIEGCTDSAPTDSICDAAYTIPGSSGSLDHYPLTVSGTPVTSSTGRGIVYVDTSTGTLEDLIGVNVGDIPEAPPAGADLSYGLFGFNITDIPIGSSVTMTLTFPAPLPPETTYWKYGANLTNPTPHWYTIPSMMNGNKLTITLTDGASGDDDLTPNGRIRDPGGPSLPPVITIDTCTQITSPGVYMLNQSILDSSATNCMNITSSDVIFDGGGYMIDGIHGWFTSGVYVTNPANVLTNVTVKNVTITDWHYGIFTNNTAIGKIANNTVILNREGMYHGLSSNNTLSENNILNNEMGISLLHSRWNTLKGNNISHNFNGIGVGASHDNLLIDNKVNSSGNNSITFVHSNNNTLKGNNISNSLTGILLISSNNNTIYNNSFNNTKNAHDEGYNSWNITKQVGTNIIGGLYLGGNYWSDYAGNDTSGDRLGDTSLPYNSSGDIVHQGDYLPLVLKLGITQNASEGGTVTTDPEGRGTTASHPVITEVTTPNAGTVSIEETTALPSSSYQFIGQQITITAPPGSVSNPLIIVFRINSSLIPAGEDENTIQILRNGVEVPPCTGAPGTASPDPCVSSRSVVGGDIEVTVLTSTASDWVPAIIERKAGPITVSISLVPVGSPITASAPFIDRSTTDVHSAEWNWSDGKSPGIVIESDGSGIVTGSHTYAEAGIYAITLDVTSAAGNVGSAVYRYVVVYDPDGGFVTGGGWIDSPMGAYSDDETLTGRAHFEVVSKYKKGANVPTGVTEFRLREANLNFHSETCEWLIVADKRAQFKGSGTINSVGNYGFMVTVIDGETKGARDRFRIKIWDMENGNAVVYDNQIGYADDAYPTAEVKGGSVVIHSRNN